MIKKSIPTEVRIDLVDKDFRYAWAAIDEDGMYKEKVVSDDVFSKGFGRGVYQLSRVAFNEKKDMAYLEYGHVCGGLCGGTGIFVFMREKEKWIFIEEIMGALY